MITMIFSSQNQIKLVKNLFGDDAQTFVDKIDEVSFHTIISGKPINF